MPHRSSQSDRPKHAAGSGAKAPRDEARTAGATPRAVAVSAPVSRKYGLLFELEHVSTKGRQREYKALKEVLGQYEIPLAPWTYSRYCMHRLPEEYLPRLAKAAGRQRVPKKLADEIGGAIRGAFCDGNVHLDEGLARMLKAAEGLNMAVGAVTGLDRETANVLMAKLNLAGKGIELVCVSDCARGFPAADAWLKLATNLGMSPKRCVALASSAAACRAALAAGMRCAAVTDDFTAFEDFSGTDYVVEQQTEALLRDLLALLT